MIVADKLHLTLFQTQADVALRPDTYAGRHAVNELIAGLARYPATAQAALTFAQADALVLALLDRLAREGQYVVGQVLARNAGKHLTRESTAR